jgi:LysM repeat protein
MDGAHQEAEQVSLFAKAVCAAVIAAATFATSAGAAVPHTVLPGETLWSIAAANNLTTRTVAAYNGLSEDAQVYTGQTLQVPTEAEGAAALASAGVTSTGTAEATTSGTTHTVQPGESLSSVAAANGISPDTLAADNGLSADALLISGQQIMVPTSSSTGTTTSSTTASPPAQEHPSWTSPVYCPSCPSGEAYLASNAAANWNAMRQASLNTYGMDLYPAGPYSAYRSYGQQLYLYDLYLSGQGNLAAPPGTSSHEYGYALDLADPSMRTVVDEIGASYGWAKTEASSEWWHVNYVGP